MRNLLVLLLMLAGPAYAVSFIQWQGEEGVVEGGSASGMITVADGTFSAPLQPPGGSTVEIWFQSPPLPAPFVFWRLSFNAVIGQPLVAGTYENASKYLSSSSQPGLDINGDSSACTLVSGRFTVYEIEYASGALTRFAADFEQHCDGRLAGLFGAVRFNSDVPYTPPPILPLARHLSLVSPLTAPLVLAGSSALGPSVRTLDKNSQPIPNEHVVFSVPSGCGKVNGAASVDVVSGQNAVTPVIGFIATQQSGTCMVTASLPSADSIQIPFEVYAESELAVTPSPSASIATNAGQSFQVGVNILLRGSPLANRPVTWSVGGFQGGASASVDAQGVTDSSGTAIAHPTANGLAGNYTIVADLGGVTQAFNVTQGPSSSSQHASVASPLGSGTISVSLLPGQSGCQLSEVFAYDMHASSVFIPANYGFPFGGLTLGASHCAAGQGGDFVVTYPQPLPAKATLWQFGVTPDDHFAHWYQLNATISGPQVTVHVVDGGPNDDAVQAGVIAMTTVGVMVPGGLYQDMWWVGPAENGWGMSLVQHNDLLFGALYIYDVNGKPIWVVMPRGDWDSTHKIYAGAVYKPIGTPFYAYNAQNLHVGDPVGNISITFQDANNAILDYTLAGMTGRKLVTREIFANGSVVAPDRSDLWWGGTAQNGWGITVLQQASTLFGIWFTYDANEDPFWYVMPGGTWTASDTYEGHIYRTTGSPWVGAQYDPTKLQVFDVGTYRIQFTGDNASVNYTVDGHTGTLPLVREPF